MNQLHINRENNPLLKSKEDFENLEFLANLSLKYPKNFSRMLSCKKGTKKYAYIINWINSKTPKLSNSSFKYNIATKCNWIFKGLTDFPICENCKGPIGENKNIKLNSDYPKHCSLHCARTDIKEILQIKQTKLERYGSENYVNYEKAKKTKFERYGDEHYMEYGSKSFLKRNEDVNGDKYYNNREKQKETFKKHCEESSDFKTNMVLKSKQTKLERYGSENYTNPEKTKKTCLERYGVESIMQRSDFREKANKTKLKKYGYVSPFSNKLVQDKAKQTWLKKYGVNFPLSSLEIREKIKQFWIDNFGVNHNFKLPEIREKIKETNMKLYGNSFGVSKRSYIFDNQFFDSSWELIFWIYCKDHNIDIVRSKKEFKFEVNGKIHTYCPDFEVYDYIIEIKGDHFFDDNGLQMKCPFSYDSWTDEQKKEYDEIYQKKFECMLENNVIILIKNDLLECFEYFFKHYDKQFLQNCKR